MRVLIVLPGAIGDVVRALPLLGRVRRGWPDARLGWSVEPLSAPLLAEHPWIDTLHVFARSGGVAAFVRHARELREAEYDVAIDLGRGIKSAVLAWASGAPRRLGFDRSDAREGGWRLATEHLPPQGVEEPKLEQCWRFGDLLGLPDGPREFGLAAGDAARASARALLGEVRAPLVGAVLGSSCPSRRWFPDRTAALLDELHARHGTTGVLLGTRADQAFGEAVGRAATSPTLDLVGRTSLAELLAVLACVDVVAGPDSGALHMAAAVGTPVVSLWGATSAWRSAPWGAEDLAVSGAAPCAPCFLKTCPIGRRCMRRIGVAAVLAAVERGLAEER